MMLPDTHLRHSDRGQERKMGKRNIGVALRKMFEQMKQLSF